MKLRSAMLAPLSLFCIAMLHSAWGQTPATPTAPTAPATPTTPTTPATPTAPTAPVQAGVVKRVIGSVTVLRAGIAQPALPGFTVQVGDTLRTGPDGAAGITLADDTLLTAGPDSELVISDFSFDPITQEGNLLVSLWRGSLGAVTGLIGKKAPEKVRVQTRTVVLGVRGTEFIVDAGQAAR